MEIALAALVGMVITGSAMLLRDDMLGRRHAQEAETRLRIQIEETETRWRGEIEGLERRQGIYEADFKTMLKEISELKGMVLSLSSKVTR